MISRYVLLSLSILMGHLTFSQQSDTLLTSDNQLFTTGHIYTLHQAVQGWIPGLLVSRPGADPNGNFDMIYRGHHTLMGRMQPLLALDGIPGLPWHMMDPILLQDIQVRSGISQVHMGLQAAGGVMDATVRRNPANGLHISISQGVSIEYPQRTYEMLSRKQFAALYPQHQGSSNTNWLDELTRTGYGFQNSVAISSNQEKSQINLIASHRQVIGTQPGSDFGQFTIYGNANQQYWQKKINLGISSLITDRNSNLGDPLLMESAFMMSPTLARNEEPLYWTGGWGNPINRLERNIRTQSQSLRMIQANVTVTPIEGLKLKLRSGKLSHLERGNFNFDEAGFLSFYETFDYKARKENARTYAEADISYQLKIGQWQLTPGYRGVTQSVSHDFA